MTDVTVIDTVYDGTAHYEQLTQLDGSLFKMIFDFNSRDNHWYLSLYTDDDTPIAGALNMKLVQNWAPMRLCRDANKPKGYFLVASEHHDEPGIADLGDGTYLYYIPEGAGD
jgi:hypothetical protein